MSETNRTTLRTIGAGVAGAAIALAASQAMNRPVAQAQAGLIPGVHHSIPAIAIGEGSIALVMGEGNQYFVIDRAGNAYPVRYRNEDGVAPVGSTLLQAP
jgi:hypothetical protein